MARTDGSVLVADDDAAVGGVLAALLHQAGFEAQLVSSGEKALAALTARPFDVLLTDLRMPGMDGMQLLESVRDRWPETPIIMITAHGTVPLAVEAMKKGAADFISKPFDREEVVFAVKKAVRKSRESEAAPSPPTGGLLGTSAATREVQALLVRIGPGTATVLIRGESGTGKELAARAIHELSSRRTGPFVKVHCAALPDTLLESELFGYEKGAFTGAASRKPGRVELAAGGTLFLDEIGDISASAQVKLLRLLQDREYERLGGTDTLKADLRFVAATHRNLEEMVSKGQFREDLFYRLNVVPVVMPALRDRPEDVEILAKHFGTRFGAANGKPKLEIAPDALDRLKRERWPGNVRQIQNLLERLAVLADGEQITLGEVDKALGSAAPLQQAEAAAGADPCLVDRRRSAERDAVTDALKRAKDNRTLAAKLLGVSRRTLYNKLEELGLATE